MTMITKKVACGLQKVTKEDGRTVLEPVFVEVECPEDMHRITGEIEHCKTVVPKVEHDANATAVNDNTGSPTTNTGSPTTNTGSPKGVVCIDTGEVFNSATQASEVTGVTRQHICACCKGKRKTAGGYHWRYVDVTE